MESEKLIKSGTELKFRRIGVDDIPLLRRFVSAADSRTCDYTVGGIVMWTDYFGYEMCVYDGTLFIKGLCEDDLSRPAFSLPLGCGDVSDAVERLREYCIRHDVPLVLSAVPEDSLVGFAGMRCSIDELSDWADYVYDIKSLATLKGNKYSKKRNHYNRFVSDNAGFVFEPLSGDNLPGVYDFYLNLDNHDGVEGATAAVEREAVFDVLRRFDRYPFEGAVLKLPDGSVAAFTVGEVIGDTLYVHIEKMRHAVAGAGETVNKLFAERMLAEHPLLRWVNREEDVGDEGLRRAKESYHPVMKLRKYNLIF